MAHKPSDTYIRYTQVFNNLGVLEMSAGVTAIVLSTIAVGTAPNYYVVPILGWQGSLLLALTGIAGLLVKEKYSYGWITFNMVPSIIGVLDLVGCCIGIIHLTISFVANNESGVKDGVLAIYLLIALAFVLGAIVLLIHAGYAISSFMQKT